MKKYLYFVSYMFTMADYTTGIGNTFFDVEGQVETVEMVRDIEKKLNEINGSVKCGIINFTKLKEYE